MVRSVTIAINQKSMIQHRLFQSDLEDSSRIRIESDSVINAEHISFANRFRLFMMLSARKCLSIIFLPYFARRLAPSNFVLIDNGQLLADCKSCWDWDKRYGIRCISILRHRRYAVIIFILALSMSSVRIWSSSLGNRDSSDFGSFD